MSLAARGLRRASRRGVLWVSLAALFLLLQFLPAQQAADVSALPAPGAALPGYNDADMNVPAVAQDYRIGANDLLTVTVLRMPDYSREVRVAGDGTIELPLLAHPLRVAGNTAPEVARIVAGALSAQQLAVSPTVQVVVRQVLSRPIVVSGAVKTPMVLQAARPMRLLEVLARAGGLDISAGTSVLVSETRGNSTTTRTVNLAQLTLTADPAQDPLLTGGEAVRVLPTRRVFTVGAFLKPGAFDERYGQPLTVLNAVALSEGFSPNDPADKKHAYIIRTDGGGQRQIPINLDDILKRKAPDPLLEAGDVLYVPVSGSHKLLQTALNDASQILVLGVGYNASRIF